MATEEKETPTTETEEKTQEKKTKKQSKTSILESKIEELEKENATLNDRYARTAAEYDNYRKRTTKELDSRVRTTKAKVVEELLPVIDNFDRAALDSTSDFDGYKKGIEMTHKQFTEVLTKLGVECFGEEGDKFDPNIHNAVMHEDNDEMDENVIAQVFMKGYKIGETIIRPATVKVYN